MVVSGVLRFGQGAAPALILEPMMNGRMPFLLSADLLAEYRSVLLRPLFVARHCWDGQTVAELLAREPWAALVGGDHPLLDARADSGPS